MPPALIIGGAIGAIGGAISGAQGSTQNTVKNVGPATAEELYYTKLQKQQLSSLNNLIGSQPTSMGRIASVDSFQQLAQQLIKNGGLPDQKQIGQANSFASQIFAPQQLGLQQAFQDQRTQYAQMAAAMGRAGTDPVLNAKLAQEQTRQQGLLNLEQGSLAAQIGLQIPQNMFQYGQSAAQVGLQTSALAQQYQQQVMQNKLAIAGLTGNALSQQMNFRLGSAGETTTVPGSFGSAFGGFLGGLGGGIGIGNVLNKI